MVDETENKFNEGGVRRCNDETVPRGQSASDWMQLEARGEFVERTEDAFGDRALFATEHEKVFESSTEASKRDQFCLNAGRWGQRSRFSTMICFQPRKSTARSSLGLAERF